uniref:ATP synthase subunit a n=1 Tax=Stereobalanus canadensis TaxID=560612 RepID=A0A3S7SG56_9BILA|nr:ATP synthase F0 subunit 6 [Stereobalanus canadensis]AXY64126.1 ATP synthase F0 subunit 6 [Stereobalanus canadensis]
MTHLLMPSLFDQFNPPYLLLTPLILPAILIPMLYPTILPTTNWFPTRSSFLLSLIKTSLTTTMLQPTGKKSSPWAALLLSLFLLLLLINLLGLSPYSFTPTAHFSLTLSLALPLWLSVTILGFRSDFNSRLSHLVPQGTPFLLIPLLVWIETLSLMAQPLALSLRLAANLTAGHLLMYLLTTASLAISSITLMGGFCVFTVLTLLFMLEMAVACMQAYVFTALAAFYLQNNLA